MAAAAGFPNYFVINGPRGNWGQGCALPSHETQMEYILQCARKMQEDRIKSMEPKQNVTTQLNQYMDAWHAKVCTTLSPFRCRILTTYADKHMGRRMQVVV